MENHFDPCHRANSLGAKKLPEPAQGLGKFIKELEKAIDDASEALRHAIKETLKSPGLSVQLPVVDQDHLYSGNNFGPRGNKHQLSALWMIRQMNEDDPKMDGLDFC